MDNKKTEQKKINDEKISEKDFTIEIPVEGSLGLLAYGAKGLDAWREKKLSMAKQKPETNE